ncbi:Short chain dehydrogenase andC [Hyphodiscus hymeniophilus]|uniref:Short chain dehydrogenase andC n=1 Tax=Hyphodiscus hymeniophilus TaxID=353542 RepID=A0A9P6VHS3_9HELO|nr:Short chain dehydrogenase andC [Hyphodiscus hymeniophilus]
MTWNLEGKVAIVTGCASGIGLTTTRLYLEAGARVFGIDISPFPEPSPFSKAHSHHFYFHRADLTTPGACEKSVNQCLSKTGKKIDILANVAGIMDSFEAVHKTKDTTWDRVISVNTTVPMKLMRAVLNDGGMLEQKSGQIINVASKAGISGAAAGFAYTASKHALIGMTKQAAWRYHHDGIRVNAVCPGGVATNIKSSIKSENLDQESLDILKPFHDLNHTPDGGQTISPEDIANAILFLSVDASRNVSGIIVPVDNAWSAV